MSVDDSALEDRMADALGEALRHAANEAPMIARLEEFFSPQPARLATSAEEVKALEDLSDRVTRMFGGAARLIVKHVDDPKPTYDTYLSAAIDEAIAVFHRTRRSLCRAQAFLIGAHLLKTNPDLLSLPDDTKVRVLFQTSTERVFWEHTETTFIRLAGFWDRLGQILDCQVPPVCIQA